MDYLIFQLSDLSPEKISTAALSQEELAEASRRGANYAITRALLRQELARRCRTTPESIVFEYGSHGKPQCNLQHFNISHSGDCLCMAFHGADVGVDVERIRTRDFEALGKRFMCPEQYASFCSRGCPEDEFFACWTAAEALVKHAGDTMWNARQYPFIYRRGRMECLYENAPHLHLFTPLPGYAGAIAYTPV